jgi:DNA-binding NarL/FixJ family response regulator
VIVLTTFDMDEYVYGAMRAGAAGFLLKSVDAGRLVESVRLVAAGDGVIEPSVTCRLMASFALVRLPGFLCVGCVPAQARIPRWIVAECRHVPLR